MTLTAWLARYPGGFAIPVWFSGSFVFPFAVSTRSRCHPRLSSTTSRSWWAVTRSPGPFVPVVRVLSSTLLPGFTGPESSATNRGSATLCSFPVGGSPFPGRLYGPIGNLRIHSSRASRGKTHRLLVCRPAPVRFGTSDIGTRFVPSARPPPRTHLAGSLFATYTSSASCFLRTSHYWRCPCLFGVVLPSDTVDFPFQRLCHARRTV